MSDRDRPTPKSSFRAAPAAPTPHETRKVHAADPLLLLVGKVDEIADQVRNVDLHVVSLGAEMKTTRGMVVDQRKDHGALEARVAKQEKGFLEVDGRIRTSERNLKRHDSGFRQASENDLKIASDQAAQAIAIEEARNHAKKAAEEVSSLRLEMQRLKESSWASESETKAQTPVIEATATAIAGVAKDQKTANRRTPLALGLSLALAVVSLALEVLRHMGNFPLPK